MFPTESSQAQLRRFSLLAHSKRDITFIEWKERVETVDFNEVKRVFALRHFDLFFSLGCHCEDFFRQQIKLLILVCKGLLGIQLSDKLIEFLVQND